MAHLPFAVLEHRTPAFNIALRAAYDAAAPEVAAHHARLAATQASSATLEALGNANKAIPPIEAELAANAAAVDAAAERWEAAFTDFTDPTPARVELDQLRAKTEQLRNWLADAKALVGRLQAKLNDELATQSAALAKKLFAEAEAAADKWEAETLGIIFSRLPALARIQGLMDTRGKATADQIAAVKFLPAKEN